VKRIDLGIVMNLYDFRIGGHEEVGYRTSSVRLSVYVVLLLEPENFVGFYSYSVFIGLCIVGLENRD
jgi:hypothetical protein